MQMYLIFGSAEPGQSKLEKQLLTFLNSWRDVVSLYENVFFFKFILYIFLPLFCFHVYVYMHFLNLHQLTHYVQYIFFRILSIRRKIRWQELCTIRYRCLLAFLFNYILFAVNSLFIRRGHSYGIEGEVREKNQLIQVKLWKNDCINTHDLWLIAWIMGVWCRGLGVKKQWCTVQILF